MLGFTLKVEVWRFRPHTCQVRSHLRSLDYNPFSLKMILPLSLSSSPSVRPLSSNNTIRHVLSLYLWFAGGRHLVHFTLSKQSCWIDGSKRRKHADGRMCTSIALAIFCLIRYKGAESRYFSCSSRCFPIRMFVRWMDRSDGPAISSQEDLFFP